MFDKTIVNFKYFIMGKEEDLAGASLLRNEIAQVMMPQYFDLLATLKPSYLDLNNSFYCCIT